MPHAPSATGVLSTCPKCWTMYGPGCSPPDNTPKRGHPGGPRRACMDHGAGARRGGGAETASIDLAPLQGLALRALRPRPRCHQERRSPQSRQ
eukprot:3035690-Heterocapsa_arctica.AAC.1